MEFQIGKFLLKNHSALLFGLDKIIRRSIATLRKSKDISKSSGLN